MEELELAVKLLNMKGWRLNPEEVTLNRAGNVGYIVSGTGEIVDEWPEDAATAYMVEVDPETGASRHRGAGAGCFWTEWEGEDE